MNGQSLQTEVNSLMAKKEYKDVVELKGQIPYKDVPKILNKASIGLVTLHPTKKYREEPYPVKLFEYKTLQRKCLTPVVMS